MRKLSPIISVVVVVSWAGAASAQTVFTQNKVIFDSITTAPGAPTPFFGAVSVTNSATPPVETFMGEAFNAADPGTGVNALQVTGLDFLLGARSTTDYTNIVANIQFYNFYSGAISDSGPNPRPGTDPLGNPTNTVFFEPSTSSPVSISLGAVDTTGTTDNAELVLEHVSFISPSTPDGLTVTGLNDLGIVINIQGDTGDGSGLQSTNFLTAGVRNRQGSPIDIGSVASTDPNLDNNTMYFRNSEGESDYNFVGADARDLAPGNSDETSQFFSALGLRIYAEGFQTILPEPSSLGLACLGAALGAGGALGASIRRRRGDAKAAASRTGVPAA